MTTAILERPSMKLSTSSEFVAAAGAATVGMGERLHLYNAMDRLETATAIELAMVSGSPVWFAEGWLRAQVNAGYAVQNPETERYSLFCRIDG
jgi:predicted nicotinamide N-methyase